MGIGRVHQEVTATWSHLPSLLDYASGRLLTRPPSRLQEVCKHRYLPYLESQAYSSKCTP